MADQQSCCPAHIIAVQFGPPPRHPSRRLRGHGQDRRRRHGAGLSGARHEAQSRRRAQSPARLGRQRRDRLARFTREAQILASLNHPQIAAIYGLEESGGLRALVMELVEGDDLSQRIARGAMPLDEALPIAKQIAEALEAAHEQGIIHRDLKPANIKVRADGTVKVLDFGLAKALGADAASAAAGSLSMSPTITTPVMTQAGMILGTAAYMSPEQAKGRATDARSDIWAFGCVLYEMLAGKPAFAGDTVVEILGDILKSDPDWRALAPETPPAVVSLLKRCLQKDRNRRMRDVADARFQIEEAASEARLRSLRACRRGEAANGWPGLR